MPTRSTAQSRESQGTDLKGARRAMLAPDPSAVEDKTAPTLAFQRILANAERFGPGEPIRE